MPIFGSNNKRVERMNAKTQSKQYEKARPYFEEYDMLNVLEKHPKQAALIGSMMNSSAFNLSTLSLNNIYTRMQIEQNNILMKQNEEIIELLKKLTEDK